MLFLQKLKTLSKYKKITIVFGLIACISCIIQATYPLESSLKENETTFIGRVKKTEVKEDYIVVEFQLDNKEVLRGYCYDCPDFKAKQNDLVKIKGELNLLSKNTTPYLFSYQDYAKRKNMFYSVSIESIEIVEENKNLFYKIKNLIIEKINNNPSYPYLFAFLLGDKQYIEDDVTTSYQENGISHLFAISGMHVSFLTLFLLKVFKKLKLSKKTTLLLSGGLLWFYAFLISYTPSVLRACLFYVNKGIKKEKCPDEADILSLLQVFFLLLIFNYQFLFDVGFQFSFLISFALLYASSKEIFSNKKTSAFWISFLSFFVSLPISICNFHQVNILSIIWNLFFVPFVSLIVFPFSFVTFLFPITAPIYQMCILALEKVSLFLQTITFGKLVMRHPSFIMLLFIVIFLLLCYILFLKRKKIAFILVVIFVFVYSNLNFFLQENYLVMLDIGQGDSILIHSDNKTMLVDTGGSFTKDLAETTIIPYLRAKGISKLDLLVLSHGDFDHVGSTSSLVEKIPVELVIFNNNNFNKNELQIIEVLKNKKIPYKQDNNSIYKVGNFSFQSLNTSKSLDENEASIVLFGKVFTTTLLLTGDAPLEVEEKLVSDYEISNVSILKVGHHGSKTSSSDNFINEINPKYSIISVGKNNRYGHPNDDVLDNLENSIIYRTDLDGSIIFKIRNNKLEIETCAP